MVVLIEPVCGSAPANTPGRDAGTSETSGAGASALDGVGSETKSERTFIWGGREGYGEAC